MFWYVLACLFVWFWVCISFNNLVLWQQTMVYQNEPLGPKDAVLIKSVPQILAKESSAWKELKSCTCHSHERVVSELALSPVYERLVRSWAETVGTMKMEDYLRADHPLHVIITEIVAVLQHGTYESGFS